MMNRIIIVAGPTAVGKTEYSIEIAKRFDGEIVSADSMQLYKYMDIGSAKPTAEEQAMAVHHLIDCIDPRVKFSVAQYQTIARNAISDILKRGKIPVVSGGTGLYVNSLVYEMDFAGNPADESCRKELERIAETEGNEYLHSMLMKLDSEAASRIHPNNVKKVIRAIESAKAGKKIESFSNAQVPVSEYEPVMVGLIRNRDELYDRINTRVDILMESGLADEVLKLMNMGLTQDDISMKGIGYKEVIGFLSGEYSIEYCSELIKKNTRHYAKRQLTWFRRYEQMKWFNLSDYENRDKAIGEIVTWLQEKL